MAFHFYNTRASKRARRVYVTAPSASQSQRAPSILATGGAPPGAYSQGGHVTDLPYIRYEFPVGGGGRSNANMPRASFDYEQQPGDPNEFCFTSTSFNPTNGGLQHNWGFHDGTAATSSEENPCHTFPGPGDYCVTLAVTNPEGFTAQQTQCFTIGGPPAEPNPTNPRVDFTAEYTVVSGCGRNSVLEWTLTPIPEETFDSNGVQYDQVGANAMQFVWTEGVGAGASPPQTGPTATFQTTELAPGVFTVMATDTVTNDTANPRTKTFSVDDTPPPQPDLNVTAVQQSGNSNIITVVHTPRNPVDLSSVVLYLEKRGTNDPGFKAFDAVDVGTMASQTGVTSYTIPADSTSITEITPPLGTPPDGFSPDDTWVVHAAYKDLKGICGATFTDAGIGVEQTEDVDPENEVEFTEPQCAPTNLRVDTHPVSDMELVFPDANPPLPSSAVLYASDLFFPVGGDPGIPQTYQWTINTVSAAQPAANPTLIGERFFEFDLTVPVPATVAVTLRTTFDRGYDSVVQRRVQFAANGTATLEDPAVTQLEGHRVYVEGIDTATTPAAAFRVELVIDGDVKDTQTVTVTPGQPLDFVDVDYTKFGADPAPTSRLVRATGLLPDGMQTPCGDAQFNLNSAPTQQDPLDVDGTATPTGNPDEYDLTGDITNQPPGCTNPVYYWILPDGTTVPGQNVTVTVPRPPNNVPDSATFVVTCDGQIASDPAPLPRPPFPPTLDVDDADTDIGTCQISVPATSDAAAPVTWTLTTAATGFTTSGPPPFQVPVLELPAPGTVTVLVRDGVTMLFTETTTDVGGFENPENGFTITGDRDAGFNFVTNETTATGDPDLFRSAVFPTGLPARPTDVTYEIRGPGGTPTYTVGPQTHNGGPELQIPWAVPPGDPAGNWTVSQTLSGPCGTGATSPPRIFQVQDATIPPINPIQLAIEYPADFASNTATDANTDVGVYSTGPTAQHRVRFTPTLNNPPGDYSSVFWTWTSATDPAGDHALPFPVPGLVPIEFNGLDAEDTWDPVANAGQWPTDGTPVFLDGRIDARSQPFTLTLTAVGQDPADVQQASVLWNPVDEPAYLQPNGRQIYWKTNYALREGKLNGGPGDPFTDIAWITVDARWRDDLQGNTINNRFTWNDPASNPDTQFPTAPYVSGSQEVSWNLEERGAVFPLARSFMGPRGPTGTHQGYHWCVDGSQNLSFDVFDIDYDLAPAPPPQPGDVTVPFAGNPANFSHSKISDSNLNNWFGEADGANHTGIQIGFDGTRYWQSPVHRDGYEWQVTLEWNTTPNPFTITGDSNWDIGGTFIEYEDNTQNIRTTGGGPTWQFHGDDAGQAQITGVHEVKWTFYNENRYETEEYVYAIDFDAL